MRKVTPEIIEDLITDIKKSPSYLDDAEYKTLIDSKTAALSKLAETELDSEEVQEAMHKIINEIADEVRTTQKQVSVEKSGDVIGDSSERIMALNKVIEGLELNQNAREKLKEMFAGYDEAVATAQEIDPGVQVKSISEVFDAFAALGIDKLNEVAKLGKPTLIVTPKNTFEQKVAALDRNKKYYKQADTYLWKGNDKWTDEVSPFSSVTTPGQTIISIVDGQVHMPHISEIADSCDDKRSAFKAHFAQKSMRLINAHEAVVLQQLGLRDYDRNIHDHRRIIDNLSGELGTSTVSCLDDDDLKNSTAVAWVCFDLDKGGVDFGAYSSFGSTKWLRGRPSMQVMAY